MHISQGSVATFLRCGGTFNNHFAANLLTTLPVKEKNFENQFRLDRVTTMSLVSSFFGAQCRENFYRIGYLPDT